MPADPGVLAQKLSSLVGEEYVLTGPAAARFAVDGVEPALAVRPGSQQEVGSVAAACSAAGASMLPWADGALIGLGNPPSRLEVVICLDRLTQIVEFDDANLNVSVEAGVRLDALQAVLGAKREFLSLDPAQPDQITVGGLVQTNASGPTRSLPSASPASGRPSVWTAPRDTDSPYPWPAAGRLWSGRSGTSRRSSARAKR